jgi:hypothetical protein
LRTYGEIAQLLRSGIDDLVCSLVSAGRAGDDVAGADRKSLVTDANSPDPGKNKEHLFIYLMIMKRKSAFARRYRGETITELARADLPTNKAHLSIITFGSGTSRCETWRARNHFDIVDIKDGAVHGYFLIVTLKERSDDRAQCILSATTSYVRIVEILFVYLQNSRVFCIVQESFISAPKPN